MTDIDDRRETVRARYAAAAMRSAAGEHVAGALARAQFAHALTDAGLTDVEITETHRAHAHAHDIPRDQTPRETMNGIGVGSVSRNPGERISTSASWPRLSSATRQQRSTSARSDRRPRCTRDFVPEVDSPAPPRPLPGWALRDRSVPALVGSGRRFVVHLDVGRLRSGGGAGGGASPCTEHPIDAGTLFDPDTLHRLQAVRADVDPGGSFRADHGIPPAECVARTCVTPVGPGSAPVSATAPLWEVPVPGVLAAGHRTCSPEMVVERGPQHPGRIRPRGRRRSGGGPVPPSPRTTCRGGRAGPSPRCWPDSVVVGDRATDRHRRRVVSGRRSGPVAARPGAGAGR